LIKKCIISHPDLDVRIIYRSESADNPEFVEDIKKSFPNKKIIKEYTFKKCIIKDGRYIGNLHSKMIINENSILVGSANLSQLSLLSNEESGIYTNHPDIVEKARLHYLKIWEYFDE
jgi:phosphatidylserine/phosphatidylglycerophosphate/cardiolipin synthase-like enzyme